MWRTQLLQLPFYLISDIFDSLYRNIKWYSNWYRSFANISTYDHINLIIVCMKQNKMNHDKELVKLNWKELSEDNNSPEQGFVICFLFCNLKFVLFLLVHFTNLTEFNSLFLIYFYLSLGNSDKNRIRPMSYFLLRNWVFATNSNFLKFLV